MQAGESAASPWHRFGLVTVAIGDAQLVQVTADAAVVLQQHQERIGLLA
jgi:hypothetical protein